MQMKKLFKGFLLTTTALSLVFCAVGCGESKPATTTTETKTEQKPATTATTETTKTTSDSSSTVEYTTADAKFTAPDGLKKGDTTNKKTIFSINGIDFRVSDVGSYTTDPHKGGMPKTKEEFDPTSFFMNPSYTTESIKEFKYNETSDAAYMYAEVFAEKYGLTRYVKYSVKKSDPTKIIYMEADLTSAAIEKYGKVVQSFDWK